ncbi:Peptidase-S8 domain-containing protein [Fusarium sp. LHS14.1]|nr:Peptidase-S8 domain-containing protein [Fusarium sp. LHS14.1]
MASSNRDTLVVDFAVDVTERLATVARGVGASDRGNTSFCSMLSASLWLINQHLKDQKQSDLGTRLLKLLSNLEKICKPPAGPSRPRPTNCLDLTNRYPGLSLLRQNNRKNAVDGICKLASRRSQEGKEKQKGLQHILETFIKSVEDETPNPTTKAEVWVGDDFTGSMRTLYKVLSSYVFCNSGSKQTQIAGRLRLALESGSEGDSPVFDLMFLAHPHHESETEAFRWRETRITMDRRTAKFAVAGDENVKLHIDGPTHIADFCERISAREQYQLSLKISGKQLHFVEWCEGARSWVPNTPSVSLSTILRNHKLSQKMKWLLFYLLAKSVWQFYSTDWMGKEWTKESIHFMFERRQGAKNAGIYLNEPFISARFDPDSSSNDAEFRPHKFPKIKALGIVLLEIELGTVIEDHFDQECYAADEELNSDADLYAALKLFDDPDRLEDTELSLKTVIGDCLRPSKFMQHRQSVEELRKVLQEDVVDYLHTRIKAYGQPEKIKLKPTVQMQTSQMRQITQPPHSLPLLQQPQVPGNVPVLEQQAVNAKSVAFNGATASSITQAASEAWFEELDQLNEVLSSQRGEIDQTYKRVRVAVIDTGFDGNDDYAEKIEDYRDFVTNKDDVKQDNTGHGTNSVKLIYKVCDVAEVYVARVFKYDEADDDTQDLMLKAIEHAKNVWKVDIISIASGFERDHALMRKAIKRAASDETLVFAAASNYGNIRQVTFPARMQDVICVYCTDGRAKVSQSINPAAQTTKSKNFAILGEGVSVPSSVREQVTGTSVATSIAAGLAGRLLDFSRQKDCRQRIRCVGNLASVEGISAVFSHMAKGAEDCKYNCVVPGRLLQHLDEGEERAIKRARICERLSTALENIDLDV